MAKQIFGIALACIISAGGIGGIIVAVLKFSAGQISDRLFEKYKAELDRQTEKYKIELSKKEYVSKTRFDAEFSIYRELTSTFTKMISNICVMIPVGMTAIPIDDELRKKLDHDHYVEANNSLVDAQDALYANEAFIPKEFCQPFNQLLGISRRQLEAYSRRFNISCTMPDKDRFSFEDCQRSAELQEKWNVLKDQIREYLAGLDVL